MAVHFVPYHRASEEIHVNPNLMRPACDRECLQKCMAAKALPDPEFGNRGSTDLLDRESLPIPGITGDGRLYPSLVARRTAVNQCKVGLLNLSSFELLLQKRQHRLVLGKDYQPRGVLVEPMHEPLSTYFSQAAKLRGISNSGLGQRPAIMPGGRVYDDPGRLVDHHVVPRLTYDVKCHRLRLIERRLIIKRRHSDGVSRLQLKCRL